MKFEFSVDDENLSKDLDKEKCILNMLLGAFDSKEQKGTHFVFSFNTQIDPSRKGVEAELMLTMLFEAVYKVLTGFRPHIEGNADRVVSIIKVMKRVDFEVIKLVAGLKDARVSKELTDACDDIVAKMEQKAKAMEGR